MFEQKLCGLIKHVFYFVSTFFVKLTVLEVNRGDYCVASSNSSRTTGLILILFYTGGL
jgi:hypothetical protein